MSTLRAVLLAVTMTACAPIEPGAIAPSDASFDVLASDGCGPEARDPALVVEVRYAGSRTRRFAVCCSEKDTLLASLAKIRSLACEGLAVEPMAVGAVTLSSTVSEFTGKRAVTLEQGEGYVAFQCDAWLPKLVAKLEAPSTCSPHPDATTLEIEAPAAAPPPVVPEAAPSTPLPSTPGSDAPTTSTTR